MTFSPDASSEDIRRAIAAVAEMLRRRGMFAPGIGLGGFAGFGGGGVSRPLPQPGRERPSVMPDPWSYGDDLRGTPIPEGRPGSPPIPDSPGGRPVHEFPGYGNDYRGIPIPEGRPTPPPYDGPSEVPRMPDPWDNGGPRIDDEPVGIPLDGPKRYGRF